MKAIIFLTTCLLVSAFDDYTIDLEEDTFEEYVMNSEDIWFF